MKLTDSQAWVCRRSASVAVCLRAGRAAKHTAGAAGKSLGLQAAKMFSARYPVGSGLKKKRCYSGINGKNHYTQGRREMTAPPVKEELENETKRWVWALKCHFGSDCEHLKNPYPLCA